MPVLDCYCCQINECLFSVAQGLSDQAISVLSSQVRLDRVIQTGAEALQKIDIMLSELTESLTSQEQKWNSVETLLEFIFPSGLLTYNMSSVLRFCDSVAKDTPVYSGVHDQVRVGLQTVSFLCCTCLCAVENFRFTIMYLIYLSAPFCLILLGLWDACYCYRYIIILKKSSLFSAQGSFFFYFFLSLALLDKVKTHLMYS